jgi:HSP20 family protein
MALVFRGLSPLESLLQLQGSLDHLLENPARGLDLGPSARGVFPAVNIFTNDDGTCIVRAEVPGIAADDLDVNVEPRRLSISGERKRPEGEGSYHRRERRFGQFSRTIQLPDDLDLSQVSAECRDGVLTVRIAKSEATKPRQIQVQVK